MGFGLLFFGYFAAFLTSLNSYGAIFALIGYYLIFSALQKLSEYKPSFNYCVPPLAILFLCSAVDTAIIVFGALELSEPFVGDVISYVLSLLSLASCFIFHLFLYSAITSLGKDVELAEVVCLSKTNSVAISIYFLLNIVLFLLGLFDTKVQILIIVGLLLRLIYPLFALSLIYKCFRQICAPEDLYMPIKPSRFKFINDLREKQEKKALETRAARDELIAKNNGASAINKKRSKKK